MGSVDITMSLKYLSNFRRTLEMPLISYEIIHILTCFVNCVSSNNDANQVTNFMINQ